MKNDLDFFSQLNVLPDLSSPELKSFIFFNNFNDIDLNGYESSMNFLLDILPKKHIVSLISIYLSILEKENKKKFYHLLSKVNDSEKDILKYLSIDLMGREKEAILAIQLQKEELSRQYGKDSPLVEVFENRYLQDFCNGLMLAEGEGMFLILNIINSEWKWLFPQSKEPEYRTELFFSICNLKDNSHSSFIRKANDRLMSLGIFSAPWSIADWVRAFFFDGHLSFTAREYHPQENHDIYDYLEISNLNGKDIAILMKSAISHIEKGTGCWQAMVGGSDFRNTNYISSAMNKNGKKLYVLEKEIANPCPEEISFYIYAISILLKDGNSSLFITRDIISQLIQPDSHPDGQEIYSMKYTLPSHVSIPIFISIPQMSPSIKASLYEKGIDILFHSSLMIPERDLYFKRILHFFYDTKVPESILRISVDECTRLHVPPEKWEEVASILRDMPTLTPEEVKVLLSQKYSPSRSKGVSANGKYCMDALNTSEPAREIVRAIRNAIEFHRGEYNETTGIRIQLYGPSGTGKTAYVEEIARELDRPLRRVLASGILGSLVGETERRIESCFMEAAEDRAILLIDEADSFLHMRGDSLNHHNDMKVNEFLIQMERFPGILFCNTNLPESLDAATDRRFHFKVGFKPLNRNGVERLCESYFQDYGISETQISHIYRSGNVTPGDFGTLYGKLRFLDKDRIDSSFITEELCRIVRGKEREPSGHRIGFEI